MCNAYGFSQARGSAALAPSLLSECVTSTLPSEAAVDAAEHVEKLRSPPVLSVQVPYCESHRARILFDTCAPLFVQFTGVRCFLLKLQLRFEPTANNRRPGAAVCRNSVWNDLVVFMVWYTLTCVSSRRLKLRYVPHPKEICAYPTGQHIGVRELHGVN